MKIFLPDVSISNALGFLVGLSIDLRLFTCWVGPSRLSPIRLEFGPDRFLTPYNVSLLYCLKCHGNWTTSNGLIGKDRELSG